MLHKFARYGAIHNYGSLSFSPDGEWVTYIANIDGQLNLWKQATRTLDGIDQTLTQLTFFVEDAVRRAVFCSDGRHILIQVDHQGTENFQLYLVHSQTGEISSVMNAPYTRSEIGPNPCHPLKPLLAYSCNQRHPSKFDVHIYNYEHNETQVVWDKGGALVPMQFSPDGNHLLLRGTRSNSDQNLYLLEVQTGKIQLLTPHEDSAVYTPGPFTLDGGGFYVITNQDREYKGLAYCDLKGGIYYLKTPQWDVELVDFSRSEHLLAYIVNIDGYSKLYIEDMSSGSSLPIPSLPQGVYSGAFSPNGQLFGLCIETPTHPKDIFILDLKTGVKDRLTQSLVNNIPEDEMVQPDSICYPTFDARQIPAFLYKPKSCGNIRKVPLVLSIHGGPEVQERPTYAYNGLYQYLLSEGIGIMAPNIRGSTGYGKTYQKLIYRDWGGGDIRDIEYALLFASTLPWVDMTRIGIFGTSYGGFMVLSALTRLPKQFAVGVNLYGPCNLLTFIDSMPISWKAFIHEWVGDPQTDAAMLTSRSPLTHIESICAPLLVIQGANDSRVNRSESENLVAKLKELGREVQYIVFDGAGHGFSRTEDWTKALLASANWLCTHLK